MVVLGKDDQNVFFHLIFFCQWKKETSAIAARLYRYPRAETFLDVRVTRNIISARVAFSSQGQLLFSSIKKDAIIIRPGHARARFSLIDKPVRRKRERVRYGSLKERRQKRIFLRRLISHLIICK